MKLPSLTLLIPATLLSVLSLIITYSISPAKFQSQLFFFAISILLYFFVSQIDINMLLVLSPFFYLFNIILLILTLILGANIRGSSRWLTLGPIRIQSSELVKISLISIFAFLSTKLKLKDFRGFTVFMLLLVFISLLVVVEPDLGSTLIILALGGYLILNLKPASKFIITSIIALTIFLPIAYTLMKPYQKERISTFINPNSDPLGSSYNQIQATIAVGSGRLFGKGLGKGTQSHLHFLPEKDTDFFFASTVEELGFLGSSFIIAIYIVISLILLKYSSNTDQDELKTIFLGTFFVIFIQAIIHIGINLGIFPVTGITLPFMSVGGSSLLSFWILLSFASAAAAQTREDHSVYLK